MEAETSNEDLNLFFQAMSEVDQEETDWKLHTQFLVSKIKLLSEFSRQESNKPIELEVFGSSAEHLKFCLPNDIGDIDIMVYPVSEETIIDDSVIEVVDGVSPMYVRLRGKNHPVFKQHCLENSDYVASSFLKEFDPKLFGEKTHLLHLIPNIVAKVNDVDPENIATGVVDNPVGPSVQLDVKHSFGSITEQVKEGGKELDGITESDGFRNFLEWFAITLNPSRTFTDDHAACIDEHLSTAHEEIQKLNENPSVDKYVDTLNQLMHGEKLSKLKHKVQDIDERLANENSQHSSFPSLLDNSSNPMNVDEDDSDSTVTKSEVEQRDTKHSEEIEDDVDSTTCNLSSLRKELEDSLKLPNMEEAKTDSDGGITQVATEKAALALTQEEHEQVTVSSVQNKLLHQLLDGAFGETPFPSGTTEKLAMEHHSKIIQSGIDLVPAIKARGWPSVSKAWSTRDRVWPSKDIIAKILDSGFHIVVKAPPRYTDKPNQVFRLSFSRAELILSGELNNVQRECYRCLKIYYRSVIEDREPKIITSYFLKTVLFWTVEETGSEFWTEDNRATCVMMLLEKLHKYLKSKHLPLYFIPEVNLLEDAIVDHPEEVEFVANEFRKICKNPMSYPNVENDEHGTEKCLKNSLPASQNENRQSKETGTTSKRTTQGNDSTQFFLRHGEFQEIYKEICKELVDLVLQGNSSPQEDPIVEAIIENLRPVVSKMQDPEAEMMRVFNFCSQNIYSSHVMHPGNSCRQRILSALKGYSGIFSFAIAQDDIFAEGNEHLIVDRMLNSDTFNVSNALMPNCSDFFKNTLQVFDAPAPPSAVPCEDEDIPLD